MKNQGIHYTKQTVMDIDLREKKKKPTHSFVNVQ